MSLLNRLGRILARFLSAPRHDLSWAPTSTPESLARTLRRGDVLLIDGTSRFSVAIKYITQSAWSHAALVTTDGGPETGPDEVELIEADVNDGVRRVPLSLYVHNHTRICRPVGLRAEDIDRVVDYTETRLGHRYDLRNVLDLARFLIRTPPVPARWRRRLLRLGSGDPTKAICSSLIAQAFQSVRYPILPDIEREAADDPDCRHCYREWLHIRHHSLFAPGDFDISPFFRIVKPSLEQAFDPYALTWAQHDTATPGRDAGDAATAATGSMPR